MNFVAGFLLLVAGRVPDAPKAAVRHTPYATAENYAARASPGCIFPARANDDQVFRAFVLPASEPAALGTGQTSCFAMVFRF